MRTYLTAPLQVPWCRTVPLLIVLLCLGQPVTAQQFTERQLAKARTAEHASYLTPEEREILFYINLARTNGAAFVDSFITPSIDEASLCPAQHHYLYTLLQELRPVKNLPLVYPNTSLAEAALRHATDLSVSTLLSHASSDGTPYSRRIVQFVNTIHASEVISSGYSQGLDIVIQLLIDNNVPDFGHRRALLNPSLRLAGAFIAPHPSAGYVAVVELSSELLAAGLSHRD
jgi:uncharacterized protein YkwD